MSRNAAGVLIVVIIAVGLLIGAGFFPIAIAATIATIVGLTVLSRFERRFIPAKEFEERDS